MLIIGHRGARKEAPENTEAAFIHAQSMGCIAFELDIQLSRDLDLVVCHDSTLSRTSGLRGLVSQQTSAQLKAIDARYHTANWRQPCPIPSLQNVVDACSNVVHWQFEVKTDSWFRLHILHHKLARFIADNALQATAVVTSFDTKILALLKQNYPDIRRGLVSDDATDRELELAATLGCSLYAANEKSVNADFIEKAKKQGLQISTWTVNSIERAQALQKLGLDSLITDCPSQMLKVFS